MVVDIGVYRVVSNVSIFSCFYKMESENENDQGYNYSLLIDSNNQEFGPSEQPITIPNTEKNSQFQLKDKSHFHYLAGFSTHIYIKTKVN